MNRLILIFTFIFFSFAAIVQAEDPKPVDETAEVEDLFLTLEQEVGILEQKMAWLFKYCPIETSDSNKKFRENMNLEERVCELERQLEQLYEKYIDFSKHDEHEMAVSLLVNSFKEHGIRIEIDDDYKLTMPLAIAMTRCIKEFKEKQPTLSIGRPLKILIIYETIQGSRISLNWGTQKTSIFIDKKSQEFPYVELYNAFVSNSS